MDEVQTTNFIKLVQDCQPATFGYQGSDVLDETYRKAGKLDRSAFSIDFCPYEHGIIDTIAQVLLPNAGGTIGTRGVKAELYKLNVRLFQISIQSCMDAIFTRDRYTPHPPVSSNHMSTHPVQACNSDPWSFHSHVRTRVANSLFAMPNTVLPSTTA